MSVGLLVPLRLTGISAIVTDPCYYQGSEHMLYEVKKIQQGGQWSMDMRLSDLGEWGVRAVELSAIHSSWTPLHRVEIVHWAGVDSGQMSICGDMDAEKFSGQTNVPWDPEANAGLFNYQGACDITLHHAAKAGVLCNVMAVSETGLGDGCYPVYVWRNDNDIATRITVDFRPEEEEEDEAA